MRQLFYLDRKEDPSGISGTGPVAEGVVFDNGRTVMQWLAPPYSVIVFDSLEDLEAVYGRNGLTVIKQVSLSLVHDGNKS